MPDGNRVCVQYFYDNVVPLTLVEMERILPSPSCHPSGGKANRELSVLRRCALLYFEQV